MLISEALQVATDKLTSAGVNSPTVDAELLCCFVLGLKRSELTMQSFNQQVFPENKLADYLLVVSRRENREPLQHITRIASFRHLELHVGPGVFIPRPETEQLVELALSKIKSLKAPVVVDFCSGTGAIAISLSTELQTAKVFSVEISEQAFVFLEQNYQKYDLDLSTAKNQDLCVAFDELAGQVDLVISNPPYIPDTAVPIELEVQLHEPSLALYGGEDGLEVIRRITSRALYLLKPAGILLLEHADSQAHAISELLLEQGWLDVVSSQDLAGKDRMISASKP